MTLSLFQKTTLGLAGITSISIGAFILVAPHAFYAGYGVTLGTDPSLLSELRAFGFGLAVLGAVMLAGLFRSALQRSAILAALSVFIAFPAGRLVGLAIDGMPSGAILGALLLEIMIGALCLMAFVPARSRIGRQLPAN